MLQFVSRDVQMRLFSDLIRGAPVSYDNIVSTLEGIDSPFKLNSVYVAAAVKCINQAEIDEAYAAKMQSWVFDFMRGFDEKNNLCSEIIQVCPGLLAVILQFNDINTSIANGKYIVLNLKNALTETLKLKGCDCLFESGHLYHSILDVAFSFEEAMETINLNKVSGQTLSPTAERDSSENTVTSLLSHRVSQIVAACQSGDWEALPQLIDYTMNEISDITAEPTRLVQIITELLNIYVTQIVACDYINPPMIPDVYDEFRKSASGCEDPEQIAKSATTALKQLTDAFLEQLQKQQNPYILATQEYIKAHYAETELSLDDIAANVRISANYLSKLFSSSIGVKLFDYLTRYRVDASINDLLNTGKTIVEIAAQCGFTSSRNYIRAFKKFYEETPGEYRKSHATTLFQ